MRTLYATVLVAAWAPAMWAEVDPGYSYQGRAAIAIRNERIQLVVLKNGGSFPSITLFGGSEGVNPMWDSFRADRELGRPERSSGAVGHFVCVDGFGQPSEAERAAGLEGHGEAHRLEWTTEFAGPSDGSDLLRQSVTLPRVREVLRREVRLIPGENVVYVKSSLESLLDFDRPVNWAEHATIGSPFLERGVTVVDISSNRALTRPRAGESLAGLAHRLVSGLEFEWPKAPARAGGFVNLRAAPEDSHSLDHTGHRMDPHSEWAFVTALHPDKRLLLGYLFRPTEFPWLQTWESYPRDRLMARGLEFGTQAFDLPRREVITEGRKFGTLLYRWLPARSKIESGYLLFWTRTPEGFRGVDEVIWRDGELRVRDRRSDQVLELTARGSL